MARRLQQRLPRSPCFNKLNDLDAELRDCDLSARSCVLSGDRAEESRRIRCIAEADE